jgi:hypothetical protein
MMYYLADAGSPARFTPNELLTIAMLLQRPPGNRYPDNDRQAQASSNAARTVVIMN